MTLQQITLSIAIAVSLVPMISVADEGGTAYTDAKLAGRDFLVQGEYQGTIAAKDADEPIGMQVIALGDSNFQIVRYHGGLPGDGWKRGDEQTTMEAKSVDGKIVAQRDDVDVTVADGKITLSIDGKIIATLNKVERQSPTLGAKPSSGATVLFDGTSPEHFENGELMEGGFLAATNCASKQRFGDHTLHIEFRTPFMPKARGQGRGNSGVYMQGRYELQVLDSFGLDGKNNECGGIYTIAEPAVNICFPPLSWQTYDIDFKSAQYDGDGKKTTNARVTIKHNGVLIHDDLELPHGTPGYHGENPDPGSLFLQNHGNPVAFRNIWVTVK